MCIYFIIQLSRREYQIVINTETISAFFNSIKCSRQNYISFDDFESPIWGKDLDFLGEFYLHINLS